MHPIVSMARSVLLGAGAAAMLAGTAAHAQQFSHVSDSIRGAPSPANYFIATPDGWKHPMTPWGDRTYRQSWT